MSILEVAETLSNQVQGLKFSPPVEHCYNPLDYASLSSRSYLKKYGSSKKEVILVGMNPGPFGMAQTGVPFGDVEKVRDWLGIKEKVRRPAQEHPKRPVLGFDCERGEVSGRRLWGWAEQRFDSPKAFFSRFFVWNYCPLCFMESSGKNRTPDKLPLEEQAKLFDICDQALRGVVDALEPRWVIGIGVFAETRVKKALSEHPKISIGRILHPSPASPIANRGWAEQAENQFANLGIL
jgi:single-strand selective monofunctional uracil DNA glycosylase